MNPFYQAMKPRSSMNMLQKFQEFREQMQGKDPNAMIQQMMQSGQITQEQYNQARNQAQQIFNLFNSGSSDF